MSVNNANIREILQKQKASKPHIEDVIPEYLDGGLQKNALAFVGYMRANKMNPNWRAANKWEITCRGKNICVIKMPRGPYDNEFDQPGMPEGDRSRNFWVIALGLNHIDEYEGLAKDEGLQEIIWNNMYKCNSCNNNPCTPGIDITFLGKEFKGVCHGRRVWFFNPDEDALNCIKRLLELEKAARVADLK